MGMHIRSGDSPALTPQLAHFLTEFSGTQLPPSVVHAARRGILDWLGCALAASQHPTISTLLAVLQWDKSGEVATVIGRGLRMSHRDAALVNGQMGHLLDYDDTHMGGVILHASSPILAALFSASERFPVSGQEFIAAYVAGFEAGVRIGQSAPDHHAGGWHLTGTLGTFAAAAAVGRLVQLNAQQMVHALGIAGSQVAGMQQNRGTMCKSFHAGHAASSGLLSAWLAKHDFDSSEEIIEGKRGFAKIYSHSQALGRLTQGLGEDWMIETNGHKPYACGVVQHPAIDAMIALREPLEGLYEGIDRIVLEVHPRVLSITGTLAPTSGLHSKFSIYHSAAVAMLDGTAGISQYSDRRASDADVLALRAKIEVVAAADLQDDQARARLYQGARQFETLIEHATGTTANPMSDTTLEAKFRANATAALSPTKIDTVVEQIWAFEQLADVRSLFAQLA